MFPYPRDKGAKKRLSEEAELSTTFPAMYLLKNSRYKDRTISMHFVLLGERSVVRLLLYMNLLLCYANLGPFWSQTVARALLTKHCNRNKVTV